MLIFSIENNVNTRLLLVMMILFSRIVYFIFTLFYFGKLTALANYNCLKYTKFIMSVELKFWFK